MQVMEFVFAPALARDKTNSLKHLQMLRNRLSRQPHLMLHGKTSAQLKQRLAIPLHEFVKDRPSRWCGKRLKDIAHLSIIGKWRLACQWESERSRSQVSPIRS